MGRASRRLAELAGSECRAQTGAEAADLVWNTACVTEQIRPATAADVDAIAAMAARRRLLYSAFQPVFWAPAPNAEEVHKPHLLALIASEGVISLVSESSGELTGFVIASVGDAPAVYDPGGRTCMIDDFVVEPGRWNSTGAQLLKAAIEMAASRGAIQAVVVTGHLDHEKRDALRACGLSVASEWWVTPALRAR
jgi:GNAT superfamily N-acetyltransferase